MDVRLPDGTVVTNVPDDITQEELMARVGGAVPSVAQDVAKSAAFAVPKAVTGLLGLPGDLLSLVNRGVEAALAKKHGGKPEDYRQPGLQDYVGSEQFRKPVEAVTGKFYEPQTRAGKIVDTAAQTAATQGRGLVTNPMAALRLIAGVTAGTEGVGALTNDNPVMRTAGGLIGGGVSAIPDLLKSRQGTVIKDAIGELSDQKIADAIARQRASQNLGVPLMGTESLDTGHQLASAVYASPRGNAIVDPFVRQRAAQTNAAVQRDIIAKTGATETAQQAAKRAQDAATRVIDNAETARTRASTPYYRAAKSDTVPAQNIADAQARVSAQLGNYPESLFPGQNAAIKEYLTKLGVPEAKQASFLDQLYRDARNATDIPEIGATPQQKDVAAAMGPVTAALKDASDFGNIARGRQEYQAYTRNLVEPLTSGPVGAVAGRTGYVPGEQAMVPRVVGAIANESVTSPQEIRQLYTHLNSVDKQAFPGIAKTYIEQQLNSALTDLRSGANPTAGAKFRDLVAGNPSQRENFNEIMRGVALANGKNPDAVVAGANTLLTTLERTGRTPGIGSQTQPRGEVARELGRTKAGDVLNTVSGNPLGPLASRLNSWVLRGRYEELARVLTAPDSVEQLVKLAKLKPDGTTAQFYAASLLGLDRGISAPGP